MNNKGCNTCVCCGAEIPQGRMVCAVCQEYAPNIERRRNSVSNGVKSFVVVLITLAMMIAGCALSYKVGYDSGHKEHNFDDWQINVCMESCTVIVQTDYNLIWIYDLGQDYFGE